MIRAFALICFCLSCAAAVALATRLYDTITTSVEPLTLNGGMTSSPAVDIQPEGLMSNPGETPNVFLPIFGQADEPETKSTRRIKRPPAKPNLNYQLKGILTLASTKRAVLSGPKGEIVVRENQIIDQSARIAEILANQVLIRVGEALVSLEFDTRTVYAEPTKEPANLAVSTYSPSLAVKKDTKPSLQMVGSHHMSKEDVFALLEMARK